MVSVNCPKTRNEEFGQLLEVLTEKYCQTVMKLDELIEQFALLKGKNDKVIKFQEENFHKHDSGLDNILEMHEKLQEKQQEDNKKILKDVALGRFWIWLFGPNPRPTLWKHSSPGPTFFKISTRFRPKQPYPA